MSRFNTARTRYFTARTRYLRSRYLCGLICLLVMALPACGRASTAPSPGQLQPASGQAQFAFSTDLKGRQVIHVMNADGTGMHALTGGSGPESTGTGPESTGTGNDTDPIWSPDGSKIAFISDRDGFQQIYQMKTDGSDPVNLTNNKIPSAPGALSPDGTQIAFLALKDEYREIYVMDRDGSNQRQVTTLKQMISQFWWSPDGKYFSISSNLDNTFNPDNWKSWVVSLDGATKLELTGYTKYSPVSWRP